MALENDNLRSDMPRLIVNLWSFLCYVTIICSGSIAVFIFSSLFFVTRERDRIIHVGLGRNVL